MTFNPGYAAYTQAFGTAPAGVNFPIYLSIAPTTTTTQGPFGVLHVGQIAIVPNVGVWILIGYSTSAGVLSANWVQTSSATGDVLSVAGTANQITSAPIAGNVVLSIPAAFIAPGSIASTTTVTGGTGVIATTGNITASAVGSGLVLTPTVVGAAASPQTANGRAFAVTFSGVSIASGASQTFVITNSSITGTGTQVLLSWSGATAGSGLSISSQASTASTLTIIMTNATSATMVTSTANITFTGLVLN